MRWRRSAFVAAVGGAAWAEAPAADGSSRPPTPTVAKAPSAPADGGKSSPSGLFLRLSLGAAYLHESWNPSGGTPGAVFSGAGPSLELSIGKRVRPRLVVGGLWQFVAVSDPAESYRGTTSVAPGTDRFLDVVAAFADYYPSPRRGLHVGGSAGLLAASNLDRECCVSTYWGGALSVRVGYDVFFSRRWSLGALAQLEALPLLVERVERLGGFERRPADAGAGGHFRPGVLNRVDHVRSRARRGHRRALAFLRGRPLLRPRRARYVRRIQRRAAMGQAVPGHGDREGDRAAAMEAGRGRQPVAGVVRRRRRRRGADPVRARRPPALHRARLSRHRGRADLGWPAEKQVTSVSTCADPDAPGKRTYAIRIWGDRIRCEYVEYL